MEASRILWIKNIRPLYGEDEAYPNTEDKSWELAFRAGSHQKNIERTTSGDLILLRQQGKLTHVVQVLDPTAKTTKKEEWPWELKVKSLWHRNIDKAPSEEKVFQTKLNLQGGQVVFLGNVGHVKDVWKDKGGISSLQQHLTKILLETPI
jgi:hypothetical protein